MGEVIELDGVDALGAGAIGEPGQRAFYIQARLDDTRVTDSGLKELASLKGLTTLNLGITRVTDAGLKELAPLKGLTTLYLYSTKVTDAGVKELQNALPMCKIIK